MGRASRRQTGTMGERHLFPCPRCSEIVKVVLEGEVFTVEQKDLGSLPVSGSTKASLGILDH